MYVCDYELNSEAVDYFLENENELEKFLTSNLTLNEAIEIELSLRGE